MWDEVNNMNLQRLGRCDRGVSFWSTNWGPGNSNNI